MAPAVHRDLTSVRSTTRARARHGRKYVVAIGVDRYRAWSPLQNAVGDARGALQTFLQLGFEARRPPLLDGDATEAALSRLVKDELRTLDQDDSLVLFFAGHGHTETTRYPDGTSVKVGYLIPVDAQRPGNGVSSWLRLDTWLTEVAHLPPRHILVILDACHSGVALSTLIRWRGDDRCNEPLERLRERRSRRVITSALDDQQAMDSGPIRGHSLFTGCLIEALTGGLAQRGDFATGSELGTYLQNKVMSYPRSQQTPDFGALDLDDRGELVIVLAAKASGPENDEAGITPPIRARIPVERQPPPSSVTSPVTSPVASSVASSPFTRALDRQQAERADGSRVLSAVAGEPLAVLEGWATWAAQRGALTLITEGATLDAAVADLLAQLPWPRCLAAARARIAAAAAIEVDSVEAALDARSPSERTRWFGLLAAVDPAAHVCGWLLSAVRDPQVNLLDLDHAPVKGAGLLAVLGELGAPIAVLVHHDRPTDAWLPGAIATAAALVSYLPRHAVAVTAPDPLMTRGLGEPRASAAMSMARQGLVRLPEPAPRPPARAAHETTDALTDVLAAALARDPRTRGKFERSVRVPIYERERSIEVALVARAARLTVELDDWYRPVELQRYRRDRLKDRWLQRAGFFPLRLLAEDVDQRREQLVDDIAIGLAGRSAI